MTYYYAVNGQQAGPVSEEELRSMVASGSIPAETPIWREGMADWQPFSVALGGGPAAAAAPTGQAPVVCAVCHQTFPADQTIRYGNVNVCGGCKPRFVQGLREGAVAPGQLELAGIGARFAAKFLDSVIVGIVNMAINFAIMGSFTVTMNPNNPAAGASMVGLVNLINFVINISYNAGFLHWRGQTLGKMALNIRVVTPEGGPLSWGKAIGRPLAELLSGCVCAIGYIIAFWDPEKRTLHDRLAGTRVIKVNK